MSRARRTLRVPDSVNRTLGEDPDPLWYTGALQTENGRDVDTTPLPDDIDPNELLDEPLPVLLSGQHPDAALTASESASDEDPPPADDGTRPAQTDSEPQP